MINESLEQFELCLLGKESKGLGDAIDRLRKGRWHCCRLHHTTFLRARYPHPTISALSYRDETLLPSSKQNIHGTSGIKGGAHWPSDSIKIAPHVSATNPQTSHDSTRTLLTLLTLKR